MCSSALGYGLPCLEEDLTEVRGQERTRGLAISLLRTRRVRATSRKRRGEIVNGGVLRSRRGLDGLEKIALGWLGEVHSVDV